MKGLKKFMAFLALPAMLLAAAACSPTAPDGEGGDGSGSGSGQGGYKDVIDRPDIEMPATPPQAVYPAKPASKPSAPTAGVRPSIASYTAFKAESTYTITEEDGTVHVSYHDVTNFAYVYAEVENYSPEYGNVKITIENSGAERIAIQAVYYEQYELGYLPVTVYMSELTAGEQYAIFEMKESMIIDDTYTAVQGQSVKDKTVLGFVIFIDSLPSYAPEEASGELDIVNFEFLPDGDPALEDRYVKPVADLSAATADTGVTLTPSEEKLTASGNGSVYIPVEKYSVDYAKFNVQLNGAAGTQVDVAVRYTIPGATNAISTAKRVTLTGADEAVEYSYEALRPTEGGDDLTTQYVKNGTVTAVVITSAEGDEIEILGVTFLRTAKEGAYVADNWMPSTDVTIPRAANGGNAKLAVSFNESWNNISVGVKNGANVTGIRYTIYAPDGLVHLGIGLVNNSLSKTDGQNAGHFILRGSAALFNGNSSVSATIDSVLEGTTETIAYDAATKIYTITYDFSETTKIKLEDYTITSLLFYPHCPVGCANKTAHQYNGTHNLYFLSIDFLTK